MAIDHGSFDAGRSGNRSARIVVTCSTKPDEAVSEMGNSTFLGAVDVDGGAAGTA